jgi:hypothetical protein
MNGQAQQSCHGSQSRRHAGPETGRDGNDPKAGIECEDLGY